MGVPNMETLILFNYWILTEVTTSFAFGDRVVKLAVFDVRIQDVPVELLPEYIVTVQPVGIFTDEAQLSTNP